MPDENRTTNLADRGWRHCPSCDAFLPAQHQVTKWCDGHSEVPRYLCASHMPTDPLGRRDRLAQLLCDLYSSREEAATEFDRIAADRVLELTGKDFHRD